MCWRAMGNPNGNAMLLSYIYNVQLMLTEERRKYQYRAENGSALDIVFC